MLGRFNIPLFWIFKLVYYNVNHYSSLHLYNLYYRSILMWRNVKYSIHGYCIHLYLYVYVVHVGTHIIIIYYVIVWPLCNRCGLLLTKPSSLYLWRFKWFNTISTIPGISTTPCHSQFAIEFDPSYNCYLACVVYLN